MVYQYWLISCNKGITSMQDVITEETVGKGRASVRDYMGTVCTFDFFRIPRTALKNKFY